MTENYDLLELLKHVDPARLDYSSWCSVGMALKHEGYTASVWEEWSRRDSGRFKPLECFKKWETFRGSSGAPVTAGTIVALAKEHGWEAPRHDDGYELEWDAIIGGGHDALVVVKKGWVEGQEITEPETWDPVQELVTYLETLFEAGENVGYVTESWYRDGDTKPLPTKGCWDRTAGELIQQLHGCNGDIGAVLGDYRPEAGAWIRFNPLDGNGCKNENVTEFRYALVESDNMDLATQNAIIRELELPVAAMVFSGGKSVHAIVKVDAANYDEYRKRVDYLYSVCKKNGLIIDSQNRNPSRLSRMPGVMRMKHKQFLVDTNIGKENWAVWQEWIEGVNDDLPDPESMAEVWDNLPDLAPPLIDGVLRQGHKMLLAGPSKAGKSYALIELCCAIAEGRDWLIWPCAQGKVLYVNLELDRASCLHRFKDVYESLNWAPKNLLNIDIWNLRGKAIPMDKLAPKLIRRAAKKQYIAIVIDPIYKVITGDENSADQMARFCNQFDRVCNELGAAVIYCHHHSKGTQGQKRSMDRASGSGVFARDPDTLLDLIELEVDQTRTLRAVSAAACRVYRESLDEHARGWDDDMNDGETYSEKALDEAAGRLLTGAARLKTIENVRAAKDAVKARTAWRIDGTLREFPRFKPVNLWFDYPVHTVDTENILTDADIDGEPKQRKSSPDDRQKKRRDTIENAYNALAINGDVSIKDIIEYSGMSKNTVRNYIDEHPGFKRDGGNVVRIG